MTTADGFHAVGPIAAGGGGELGADSLFRLASMTKPITTLGALRLVRLGELDLDAAVAHYVPEFARLQVLEGFDENEPRLRAPKAQATVRQLLTHTSGLGYWFQNPLLLKWRRVHGTGTKAALLEEPLVSDPGTRFEYGLSTDWLGQVIESVAGQPLDVYLDQHVLTPLYMHDTTFHPTDEQRERLVPVHARDEHGAWRPTDQDWAQDPDWHAGGHGLYSTPNDYLRLQRALLDTSDPVLEQAFTPQVPFPAHVASAHRSAEDLSLGPGYSWGLATLVKQPQTGGWMGIYNTFFWVDRNVGRTAALYTQTQPFADPAILDLAHAVNALA
ncbi:MAG TPA: serine hydrolase domain-containing protein [Solirubrobacter sp.]|nr:serine hydrolase domain-containing protein [Solirubrobacter sp.]